MYYIDKTNSAEHCFPVYARRFASYRWYKPLIVMLLFAVFYTLLFWAGFLAVSIYMGDALGMPDIDDLATALSAGYDTLDMADPVQGIIELGGLAVAIPALALAVLIVRERPLSSYQSARGGWSHRVFWKCFPIAFLINGVPIIFYDVVLNKGYQNFTVRFTMLSFVILTVLGPLQCIAEEYLFRGFVMQAVGSWVRIPLIAVIVQSAIFALGHPYNLIGQIAILSTGTAFALSAWIGRGIEVSSALHIANNMTIFYLQGLGMTTVSSEVTWRETLTDAAIGLTYVLVIFIISRKTKWFDKVVRDDAAAVNGKIAARKARKAAKRAAAAAKKAGGEAVGLAEEAGSAVVDFTGKAAGYDADTGIDAEAADASAEYEAEMPDPAPRRRGRTRSGEGKHFKS